MTNDLFTKKLGDKKFAQAEFQRTLDVYNDFCSKKTKYLRIAKPIKMEEDIVFFENLDTCLNMRDVICKFSVDLELLFYVGYALGELHMLLNPDSFTLENEINIHGDFWSRNVLFDPSTKLVYIIDFSPSVYNKSQSYSHDYAYVDLANMIRGLEVKYPIYKPHLLFRTRKNSLMSAKFIEGYEKATNRTVKPQRLSEYIVNNIVSNKKIFQLKNPISSFIWTKLFDRAIKRYSKWKGINNES